MATKKKAAPTPPPKKAATPTPRPAPNAPGGASYVGTVSTPTSSVAPPGHASTAVTPSGPTPGSQVPVPDGSDGMAAYNDVRSIGEGFNSLAALQAAGIQLSDLPTNANFNSGYFVDGRFYYADGQQQEVGGPGLNGAQQALLAHLANPYENAQSKQSMLDAYHSGGFDNYNLGQANGGVTASSLAQANHVPGASGAPGGDFNSAANGQSAADVVKNNANRDALASIKGVLSQYGLDSLTDFAWQEIVSGRSGNEVLQDLRETPQFKQRFPAIEARQKAGLPPLSPGDYVSYENTATQYMRDAGLPSGFYDKPEDFTKFLSNDVSLKELASRVDLAKQAAYQAPTEVRTALRGQFGLGEGDLAAYFLDPNRAQPLLQRTYNAAQIAGAGTRTGYNVNADQDYRLADQGISAAQAQAGFSTLQQSQELYNPLVGHTNEGAITTDQQLGAAFGGNAADALAVDRRRQQRQADFQDGGAFAASQQGISGLGVAQPK